jgi:putative aldouronate transport system permease protein
VAAAIGSAPRGDGGLWGSVWRNRAIYALLAPGLLWYVIFAYGPMYGLTLAFKTYRASLGIWGSHWVGMENYKYVFRDPAFLDSVWRTLTINLGRLVFQFPVPILLALLLNELKFTRLKKGLQTILTFPHFLSWVVVASIMVNILSYDGLINKILNFMGRDDFKFLGNATIFQPMLYMSEIWKSAGWGAIIYLAAIAGVSVEQYEAAQIDGATRLQQIFRITLPNIMSTIIVMAILFVGGIMTMGFDQIFNLSNPGVRSVSETIDMYIYRITFQSAADFSFSMAVSLFRSVVNLILLLLVDRAARLAGGEGLLG